MCINKYLVTIGMEMEKITALTACHSFVCLKYKVHTAFEVFNRIIHY